MIELRATKMDWPRILFAPRTPYLLGIAAVFNIVAIYLLYFGPSSESLLGNVLLGIGGVTGALGFFCLWGPMWFFWLRCDRQPRWRKVIWFFLLLFGLFFAAVSYYAVVYLPAFRRHKREKADLPATSMSWGTPQAWRIGLFGKALVAGWALLFLTTAAVFAFPKGMSHVLRPVASWFVLWPATLLIATFIYAVVMALRVGLHR